MSEVKKGTTSRTEYFNLLDKTAGTPKTGLTIANLILGYTRTRLPIVTTALTTLSGVTATYASGAAIEVDSTNAPGLYRIDVPDGAYSTNANVDTVILSVIATSTASVAPALKEVQLVSNLEADTYSAVGAVAASIAAGVVVASGTITSVTNTVSAAIAGTHTFNITGNLSGSVGSVTGNVGGSVGSVIGGVGATVNAIATTVGDKTGYSTTDFTTALTESYRANGAAGTAAQILYEILGHHAEKTVSGTTMTLKKLDHSAVAMTLALDSTTPSSVSRAT